MKRNLIYLALGLMALVACQSKNGNAIDEDSLRMAEVEQQYQEATSFNDSLLLLMGDIYAGLDSINAQEGLLMRPGIGDNADRRAEIRENLSAIRQRLEMNKRLLAELEKKANEANRRADQAGSNNAVLQKTIDQMKERIATQEAKIEELNTLLANANETITQLTGQVEETQQQLTEETQAKEEAQAQVIATENAANTVYYVIGNNKQLKDWGVLEKRFLGTTKVMQGDEINYTCFKSADKRTLTSIPTGAKKVEIKSLNDAASYVIEGEKDQAKTIKITNPTLFWQKTPYLVIETK